MGCQDSSGNLTWAMLGDVKTQAASNKVRAGCIKQGRGRWSEDGIIWTSQECALVADSCRAITMVGDSGPPRIQAL